MYAWRDQAGASRARTPVTQGLWLAAMLCVALIAIPGAPASQKTTYFLSLGDSFAMGRQPIGGHAGFHAPRGYKQGYADQLLKLVRYRYEQLQAREARLWWRKHADPDRTHRLVSLPRRLPTLRG
jgi:hypothetical protein